MLFELMHTVCSRLVRTLRPYFVGLGHWPRLSSLLGLALVDRRLPFLFPETGLFAEDSVRSSIKVSKALINLVNSVDLPPPPSAKCVDSYEDRMGSIPPHFLLVDSIIERQQMSSIMPASCHSAIDADANVWRSMMIFVNASKVRDGKWLLLPPTTTQRLPRGFTSRRHFTSEFFFLVLGLNFFVHASTDRRGGHKLCRNKVVRSCF
jgi:hypothetical protein